MTATKVNSRKWQNWRSKRLCCYSRLSIVVPIIVQGVWAQRGWKPQICIWNFGHICHGSRDINISGFGGHIVISGYRSLSQSLDDTFVELVVVENAGFAAGISALSVILLFPFVVNVAFICKHFLWASRVRKLYLLCKHSAGWVNVRLNFASFIIIFVCVYYTPNNYLPVHPSTIWLTDCCTLCFTLIHERS